MQRMISVLAALSVFSAAARRSGIPAIAFDIDGVLKQNTRYCAEARAAMELVRKHNIPFCFFTNGGGGLTEAQYIKKLRKELSRADLEECVQGSGYSRASQPSPFVFSDEQIILSYSPFNASRSAGDPYARQFKDDVVVVVGPAETIEVARSYGYSKAIHINEYSRIHHELNPLDFDSYNAECAAHPSCELKSVPEWEPVKAIFAMSDPNHVMQAMQVMVDLLMSPAPGVEELAPEQIPIFFSNMDFLWRAEFKQMRFATGTD
jgi:ribonucleotide monophosphatase NagD (HAD superfamily)